VHTPLWCWYATGALILVLLLVDFAFHRRHRDISLGRALLASAVWIGVGLLFGLALGATGNWERAGEYYGGYLTEKALSIDNLFVFALLLRAFAVPPDCQRRVLFYGVCGALVLRGGLIATGATLLDHFSWILYILGGLLIFSGSRMARGSDLIDPERNPVLRSLRRLLPVTPVDVGSRFVTRINGTLVATPLLIALLAIEVTDVVFAMDSIPATFGITRDVFVVFTANAFAVLGLRALYFVLVGAMDRFTYVKFGLAALLVFIGLKMVVAPIFSLPILASLAIIAMIISVSVAFSLWHEPRLTVALEGEPEPVKVTT
jgi:tellurite resistance protein TerC